MNAHRLRVSHVLLPCLLGGLAGCPSPTSAPPAPLSTERELTARRDAELRDTSHVADDGLTDGGSAVGRRVVVLLVVDQLPAWTFSRQLPFFRGGFARLVHEGVYWPHAEYPYAATVTAVGHTALATGAPPRTSGITDNAWYSRDDGRWIDPTEDHAHLTIPAFAGKDDGTSPHHQLVDAVGTGKHVLSLSYKERAAVLMGGKGASEGDVTAVWYEPNEAAFVTSTYYRDSSPPWLAALSREHPIEPRFASYVWTPLENTPSRALVPDDQRGEVGKYGMGRVFPHKLASSSKPAVAVGGTPLANDLLLEVVRAALDVEHPDLLCVSFSGHDLAAHSWGLESWEATDVLFRLDGVIGTFLDLLDAHFGKAGWSLVFSTDHGGPPLIERMAKEGKDAVRVDLAVVERAAREAATKIAGKGNWVAATDERNLYLTPAARGLPEETRGRVLDAIVSAAKAIPGMSFAFRADTFANNAECTGLATPLETLVCRSIHPERSGDVYWGPKPYSIVENKPFEADAHGTPWDYDRQVPLVLIEPGRVPRVVDDESPSILRVAPTLARLLGRTAPSGAHESAL